MKVSIIIPVVRPDRIENLKKMIHENAGVPDSDYEIVIAIDEHGIGCPAMVASLVAQCQHDWIMFLGDDTLPQAGFLKNAIAAAEKSDFVDEWGLVALNDGIHNGELATHWLAHQGVAAMNGGYFFHPDYHHLYCDNELTDICRERDMYTYAADAAIKHDHPSINEGVKSDKWYAKSYDRESWREDRKTYFRRKAERTGQKSAVAVAVPVTHDRVDVNFWRSTIAMQFPEGSVLLVPDFSIHPGDIAKVRNDLVKDAINKNCTHILFMDSDQVYHDTDLIYRLLAHNKPIVGGKVHRRYPPFEPILQRDGKHVPDSEIEAGGLVQVDSTGTGCLMVDLDVFFELDFPWFETIRDESGTVEVGEDVAFCRKAKKAGYEIHVDCDVEIGHLATLQVNQITYDLWKKVKGVRNVSK